MLWSRWKCEVIGSFSARTSCARQSLCDIKVTVRHPGVVLCAGSRPSENLLLDNVGGILRLSGVQAVFLVVSVSTTGEALTRKYLGFAQLGAAAWELPFGGGCLRWPSGRVNMQISALRAKIACPFSKTPTGFGLPCGTWSG